MKGGALSNYKASAPGISTSIMSFPIAFLTMSSTAMSKNGISGGCPLRCFGGSNELFGWHLLITAEADGAVPLRQAAKR